jgi:hypothetical protein
MDDIEVENNAGQKPSAPQESQAQPLDAADRRLGKGRFLPPRVQEDREMGPPLNESSGERAAIESYRPFANAMLVTATFAGTITLSVVLAPGNGTHVPGVTILAYSSSIFIGTIMGCIFLISSIELNVSFALIRMEATIVGLLLFSAFYLLLLASSLFLNYRGPFILGSILYLGYGVLIGLFSLLDWLKAPGWILRTLTRGRVGTVLHRQEADSDSTSIEAAAT